MLFKVLLILIYSNLISGTKSRIQYPYNGPIEYCRTYFGVTGKCLRITDCPPFRSLITRHQVKTCYYDNDYPVICCPYFGSHGYSTIRPTPNPHSLGDQVTKKAKPATTTRRPIKKFPESTTTTTTTTTMKTTATTKDFFSELLASLNRNRTIGCGFRVNIVRITVVGGTEVRGPEEWPWMSAIFRRQGDRFKHFCGGTIISNNFILTAAHCFKGIKSPANIYIGVGSNLRNETEKIPVKKIIIHDQYKESQHYNDIALLEISQKMDYSDTVRPICLPDSDLLSLDERRKGNIQVAGWGIDEYQGRSSNKLLEATIDIQSRNECNKSYSSLETIRKEIPSGIIDKQICAGKEDGSKDTCQGDSGGPLIIRIPYFDDNIDDIGAYYQIGVTSFGSQCALAGFPGVYVNVHRYADWIKSHLSSAEKEITFRQVN